MTSFKGGGRTDGRMYRQKDVHNFCPRVLQDIGPLGPLPKKNGCQKRRKEGRKGRQAGSNVGKKER